MLHPEAKTSYHKLPRRPTKPEDPRGYGPFFLLFLPEVSTLPQPLLAPQPARRFGVGIDTSRYGHYAVFLKNDLQPAADELQFPESAAGYTLLRQRLQQIARQHGPAHCLVRLDAAGQYADNLLHFLHGLGTAGEHCAHAAASFTLTLSSGEPRKSRVLLRGSPAIRESLVLRKFARRAR